MGRPILLAALLLALPAAAQDPLTEEWQAYFRDVRGRWPQETLSERRKGLVREFQRYDRPQAAEWLMLQVLLKDPAGDVLREAVRVLATYRRPATLERMARLWKQKLKPWEARALGLYAFVHSRDASATRVLEAALKERDPRVLVCACDAVGLGNRQKMAPRLLQLLQRRSVPVQVAVLQALAAMRYEEAAPQVLRIFCGTESHRVRFEAWQTLEHLTREDHGPDPGAWKAWFDEQVAAVGEEAPNPWGTHFPTVKGTVAKPARFFRIPVMADRLCFVLDTSGDMDNAWKIDPKLERKKPREERTPSMFTVKTRWQLVRAHVKRCLEQLPPETEIAFVFYYNRIFVYPDTGRYLKNSERNRRRVLEHLEKHVKRDGTTAMYEGLRRGWGFLKDGDAKANFRKGCDTILFVTDGRPTSGALKDRADRLRDEVWRAATPRRLRIHTVGLYNHAFELLKQIAKDTGGLYVHAQEVGDPAEPQDLDFWPEKKKAFEAARKAARKGP